MRRVVGGAGGPFLRADPERALSADLAITRVARGPFALGGRLGLQVVQADWRTAWRGLRLALEVLLARSLTDQAAKVSVVGALARRSLDIYGEVRAFDDVLRRRPVTILAPVAPPAGDAGLAPPADPRPTGAGFTGAPASEWPLADLTALEQAFERDFDDQGGTLLVDEMLEVGPAEAGWLLRCRSGSVTASHVMLTSLDGLAACRGAQGLGAQGLRLRLGHFMVARQHFARITHDERSVIDPSMAAVILPASRGERVETLPSIALGQAGAETLIRAVRERYGHALLGEPRDHVRVRTMVSPIDMMPVLDEVGPTPGLWIAIGFAGQEAILAPAAFQYALARMRGVNIAAFDRALGWRRFDEMGLRFAAASARRHLSGLAQGLRARFGRGRQTAPQSQAAPADESVENTKNG